MHTKQGKASQPDKQVTNAVLCILLQSGNNIKEIENLETLTDLTVRITHV